MRNNTIMKKYKPDLNERVTIRISPALKKEMLSLCARNDLDEALVVRLALEAGVQLAKEQGLPKMMEKRSPKAPSKPSRSLAKKPKAPGAKYVIVRGEGSGWVLKTAKGRLVAKGPLYAVRSRANKLADPELIAIEE